MVEQHCLDTGERFDALVVVPRGGYHVGNILSREFGFTATHLIHACLSSYDVGETQRRKGFEYGQMPTPEEVEGKDLLIIEEVVDTGNTLLHLRDLLKLAGAGIVRSAALHHKPGRSETGVVPDFFVEETDKWIVYPWEPNEQRGKLSIVRKVLPKVASIYPVR